MKNLNTFKNRQYISTDKLAYTTQFNKAKAQLTLYQNIEDLSVKIVGFPKNKDAAYELFNNPLKYTLNAVSETYAKSFPVPVSTEKLIELMGLKQPLDQLEELSNEYTGKGLRLLEDGIEIDVKLEQFEHYTKNEAQNEVLNTIKNLIESFDLLVKGNFYASQLHSQLMHILKDELRFENGKTIPAYTYINKF